MKKFAGTWAVIAVFGALLAYLLIAKPKSKDEKQQAALTLTSSKRDSIDRIQVVSSEGTFDFVRVSGGPTPTPSATPAASPAAIPTLAPSTPSEVWTVSLKGSGRTYPVEEIPLSQMKNAFSDLVAVDPVWPTPTDAQKESVGLKAPLASATWHAADGDHALWIGKTFPAHDEVYVQVQGNPGIYLARKFATGVFQKALNDFRRHKVYEFDRDAVRSVTFEAKGNGTFLATRSDSIAPWMASAPFTGRADRGKLNNLIAKIANLRADDFVDAPDPKAFAAPNATLVLGLSDGTSQTLRIGTDPGPKWLGEDPAAGGAAFHSNAPILPDLLEPFAAWRDRSLLDFAVEDVSTLELTVDGATHGFHRGDDKMFLANDGGANVNAEVPQFLRTVKSANIAERVENPKGPQYGFEKPLLSASWLVGKSEKLELVVGAAKGTSHWVKTSESPDARLVAEDLLTAAQALASAAHPVVAGTSGAAATSKDPG